MKIVILGTERSGTTLMREILAIKYSTSKFDNPPFKEAFDNNSFEFMVYDGKFTDDYVKDRYFDGYEEEIKYIFMLRDPRAYVASKKSHGNSGHDIDNDTWECRVRYYSNFWNKTLSNYYEIKNQGKSIIKIKYEYLVSEPDNVINHICEFLMIDYNELKGNKADYHCRSSHFGKINQEIHTKSINKWKEALSEDDINIIECICKKYMSKEGYE